MKRSNKFAVVNRDEAEQNPYPYVYIKNDGSYRELHEEEKEYLEEEFHPADGDRPYVKSGYYSKTPDGDLSGFLQRSKLPKDMKIGDVAPSKPWWKLW